MLFIIFFIFFFFFQAEDGIRDYKVTGVQTCALPISSTERSKPLPAKAAYSVFCVRSLGSSTRPAPAEPLDGQLVAGNPFAVPTTRLQVVPFVEWNNSPVQLPRTQSDLAGARPVTRTVAAVMARGTWPPYGVAVHGELPFALESTLAAFVPVSAAAAYCLLIGSVPSNASARTE